MRLRGLQKTTLLDYPGHVAATIFLGGCNFQCPFCHNSHLLDYNARETLSADDVLTFLKKRKGILEGVCITGGEPTLSPELPDFIRAIRQLGYLVKLDTNGYQPEKLRNLADKGLVDYIAMDIKAGRENYPRVSGVPGLTVDLIEESASFLLAGTLPYEFRTTVVKELHSASDFEDIAVWLRGCTHYYLQNYVDSEQVLLPGFHACSQEQLLEFAKILRPAMGEVSLRGVDY